MDHERTVQIAIWLASRCGRPSCQKEVLFRFWGICVFAVFFEQFFDERRAMGICMHSTRAYGGFRFRAKVPVWGSGMDVGKLLTIWQKHVRAPLGSLREQRRLPCRARDLTCGSLGPLYYLPAAPKASIDDAATSSETICSRALLSETLSPRRQRASCTHTHTHTGRGMRANVRACDVMQGSIK